MDVIVNILIDISILIFSSTGILASFAILFLIIHHRHQFPINTSTVLLCNTYLSIILSCLALFDMFIYNLYSVMHHNISFNNWWCYTRAYLLHVGFCLIYHSYLLQACFRFFRIIFCKCKRLQSIRFVLQLVLIQWLMVFLLLSLNLFFHNFEYSSQAYHCLILYSNFFGLLLNATITFYCPMIAMGLIYFYILYYIHPMKKSSISSKRQRASQRDFVVLHRILILVGMLLILFLPAILLWADYMITGYFYQFNYHLQWLTISFALAILSIVSIFLTPQLEDLLFQSNRSTHVSVNRISRWTQIYKWKTTDV